MDEKMNDEEHFTGYEYKSLTVTWGMENIYLDGFPNFGWKLEGNISFLSSRGLSAVILKFKRKICMIIKQIAVFIMALILASLLGSCATIGEYKPLSPGETLIGTVHTTFVARDTWLTKNETINMQAYIKLLEAAVRKYPKNIDVRNIIWVTGRKLDGLNTEVIAIGNVIEIFSDEGLNNE